MNTIKLLSNKDTTVTLLSNIFIDSYMPFANGEYVKVYIYMLRLFTNGTDTLSISTVADHLHNTETDVIRALNYWEKYSLLIIDRANNGDISCIRFKNLTQSSVVANSTNPSIPESETAATVSEQELLFEKPIYTDSQIAELTESEEVKWLMNIIEIYMERLLTPTDVQLILYLYETLGFSTDLIMHLYDYCISRNKKNPSYIEAVALAWAKDGINTIDKANVSISKYNTNYNAVNKAFGLNRQPGTIEKKYMDKWSAMYHFSTEIITEACNRTLLRTGKPDFKYADKILENWYTKGVSTTKDITKLDERYNKRNVTPTHKNTKNERSRTNNQFNSFPQRNYSKEDFSSLEQRLLNKE